MDAHYFRFSLLGVILLFDFAAALHGDYFLGMSMSLAGVLVSLTGIIDLIKKKNSPVEDSGE